MGQFSRDSYFTDKRPLVDNIMYDRAPGKRERVDQRNHGSRTSGTASDCQQ